jgi:hypothetical protein
MFATRLWPANWYGTRAHQSTQVGSPQDLAGQLLLAEARHPRQAAVEQRQPSRQPDEPRRQPDEPRRQPDEPRRQPSRASYKPAGSSRGSSSRGPREPSRQPSRPPPQPSRPVPQLPDQPKRHPVRSPSRPPGQARGQSSRAFDEAAAREELNRQAAVPLEKHPRTSSSAAASSHDRDARPPQNAPSQDREALAAKRVALLQQRREEDCLIM